MKCKKKLLIAIPTYNHVTDVDYFLKSTVFLLNLNWVDLTFWDSSENDDTEMLIKNLSRGHENVSVKRINSKISANEKVFMIYENSLCDYEYIWVMHDHTVFSMEALGTIGKLLDSKPDFIFLNTQAENYKLERITNIFDFSEKNAWLLGRMGASIVRTTNFLESVDWNYYRRKYLTKKCLNFSHVGFYLEQYIRVPSIVGISASFPRCEFTDTHKNKKLSWENEAVRICTECWGSVISKLPDCYDSKRKIMQSIDKYFITKYKLIEYRKNKTYGIVHFFRYKKWVKLVFEDEYNDFRYIATKTERKIYKKYIKPCEELIEKERQKARKVYIYGAGKHGVECFEFLEDYGIMIDGFIVTDKRGNIEAIKGKNVYEITEMVERKEQMFVIVAVMKQLQNDIVKCIKNLDLDCEYILWNL